MLRANRPRRRSRAWPLVIAAVALLASCAEGDAHWAEGTDHDGWRSVFTGYGTTGSTKDGTLIVSPEPATGTDTHAALIASVASYRDVDVRTRLRTTAQLRKPTPNPWEVAWVLWHYTDSTHFYYVALKPNGWEIGKEDPGYPGAQRFLASGPGGYGVGQWHTVRVRMIGATLTVWADGLLLGSLTDNQGAYPEGRIGLYAEDATGEFARPDIRP